MRPERLLSSRRVFKGRIVGLRVDAVELPNGLKAVREVVEHRPAVVVVPIDAEGNLLLVRQFRYPVGRDVLEAPAGIVEEGESPKECAARELQEAIGFASGDLRELGGFWSSPGFTAEYMYAYVARELTPSRLEGDPDEDIEVERLSVTEAMKAIREGDLRDAKTIASVLMAVCVMTEAEQ